MSTIQVREVEDSRDAEISESNQGSQSTLQWSEGNRLPSLDLLHLINDPEDPRDPTEVFYMPIEPLSFEMENSIKKDGPERQVHLTSERDLRDAYDYETELRELLGLKLFDNEIEKCATAALEAALECIIYDKATVSGTVVAVIRALIGNHRKLSKYLTAPSVHPVRSLAEISEELSIEYPRAVFRLMDEMKETFAYLDKKGRAPVQESRARRSVQRPSLWNSHPIPDNLPMNLPPGDAGDCQLQRGITLTKLMEAVEHDDVLTTVFHLHNPKLSTADSLRAALIYFVESMNHPDASVCDLIVGMFRQFLRSDRDLAKDVDYSLCLERSETAPL